MRKQPAPNTRRGLIDDPAAYLRSRTGRDYRLAEGSRIEGDFARPQADYERGRRGEPLPNCTLAALTNALGWYRQHGMEAVIPASPDECYALLRKHVRLIRLPRGGGGYPVPLVPVLTRRLWRVLGVEAWPAVLPFPSAARLRQALEAGAPLVLSIRSRSYKGHTVLLLGCELWSDGQTPVLLWVVRDGWQEKPRYLDPRDVWIYQAVRMVK